jgi:carbonic anhydrase
MCCENPSCTTSALTRREFVTRIALGGGAVLLSTFAPGVARASGGTDAVLLSCMDYRLTDKTTAWMGEKGLKGKYDHVVLAGASLGALTDKFPEWGKTFWGHLDVAIKLHHIKKVVILDHRDCGAYKVILGEDLGKEPEKETSVHARQLRKLRDAILKKHKELEVEMALMDLEGKVMKIPSMAECAA